MITVTTPCQDVKPNTFMIEGKYSELVSSSTAHWHLKRHVKWILISVHSYACFTQSGLFHESANVTECNPP